MNPLARGAIAGIAGSTAWTLSEPLLERAFSTTYSDVRLVGRWLTPGRLWPATGFAVHTALGAALGTALVLAGQAGPGRALLATQVENAVTWPVMALADRAHPDRRAGNWPPLFTNKRLFAQNATTRVVFALCFARCVRTLAERG